MKLDTKEFELPDTVFIRDIETGVFQSIVIQSLSEVKGVSLENEGILESFLGLDGNGQIKGITVDQDPKSQSISVKVEVSIAFGIPIPEKAEEIQSLITERITKITGLHVAAVHIVFKNVYFPEGSVQEKKMPHRVSSEYTDEF